MFFVKIISSKLFHCLPKFLNFLVCFPHEEFFVIKFRGMSYSDEDMQSLHSPSVAILMYESQSKNWYIGIGTRIITKPLGPIYSTNLETQNLSKTCRSNIRVCLRFRLVVYVMYCLWQNHKSNNRVSQEICLLFTGPVY